MRKRKNFLETLLILVLITFILSGCLKQKQKSVTITIPNQKETNVIQDESTEDIPTDFPSIIDTHTQRIEENSYGYYYDQLTKEQKVVYFTIFSYYEDIQKEYIKFTGVKFEDVDRAVKAINCDQFFLGIEKYIYYEENNSISMRVKSLKRKVSENQRKKVEKEANKILSSITGNDNEEIIRNIYNWCTTNIKYDETDSKNHTRDLYGALINKECVCEGYAKAFEYLCRKSNINCLYVVSKRHAWNYVQIAGQWYSVDTTWGKVHTKQFLLEGKESLEDEDHIPENSDKFVLPELAEKSAYPTTDEVLQVVEKLQNDIENSQEVAYETGYDKEVYELVYLINEKSKEILDKIGNSVFYYYINTSEFLKEYNELEELVRVFNDY